MTTIRTTLHGRLEAHRANNSRLMGELARAEREASTGKKVTRPSHDAGKTDRLHRLRAQNEDQQVYTDNADWAMGVLGRADEALGGLAAVISDARELAVQMSSETYTDADRQTAAITAQGILDRGLTYANAQFGDRYIFAGTAYDSEAFDATGAYQGDTGSPDVPIAEGRSAATGFDGSSLLQGTGDVMGSLSTLVAAMSSGDATAVQAALSDLDLATTQISEARTVVGNEMLLADDALELSQALEIEITDQVSKITEVDTTESYIRLFEIQSAFEAALQVTAASRMNGLFARM